MVARFRRDPDGAARYIGQARRGRIPKARTGIVDLGHAIVALQRAREQLELVMVAGADRGEREAARDEARAAAELGVRFVRGVLREMRPVRMSTTGPKVQLEMRFRPR